MSKKAILNFLESQNWKLVPKDENTFMAGWESENGNYYPIYFHISDVNQVFIVIGVYPFEVPENREELVLAYLNYVNLGMPSGNFEYRSQSREVVLRSSMSFKGIELPGQLLYNMVHKMQRRLELYRTGLRRVLEGEDDYKMAFEKNWGYE